MNTIIEQKRCFKNIFSSSEPPCPKPPVYAGRGTGNVTDQWEWCSKHAPAPDWRKPIELSSLTLDPLELEK